MTVGFEEGWLLGIDVGNLVGRGVGLNVLITPCAIGEKLGIAVGFDVGAVNGCNEG